MCLSPGHITSTHPASDAPTQLTKLGTHFGALPPAELSSPSRGAGSFRIATFPASPCRALYGSLCRLRQAFVSA